jgi:hypothetical protein
MNTDEWFLLWLGLGLIFFGSFTALWAFNVVGIVCLTIVGTFVLLRLNNR